MSRLYVEFAPVTVAAHVWRLPLWVWPLLLTGSLLIIAGGWRVWSIQQRLDTAKALVAEDQRRLAQARGKATRDAVPSVSAGQAIAINAAVRQLNVPWTDLLEALEAAGSKKVAYLEVRAEPGASRLLVSAEVRASDDIITYVSRLKKEQIFTNVLLSGHQVSEADGNKPIRFELIAVWRDAP
jgi:hypothetical protein